MYSACAKCDLVELKWKIVERAQNGQIGEPTQPNKGLKDDKLNAIAGAGEFDLIEKLTVRAGAIDQRIIVPRLVRY